MKSSAVHSTGRGRAELLRVVTVMRICYDDNKTTPRLAN